MRRRAAPRRADRHPRSASDAGDEGRQRRALSRRHRCEGGPGFGLQGHAGSTARDRERALHEGHGVAAATRRPAVRADPMRVIAAPKNGTPAPRGARPCPPARQGRCRPAPPATTVAGRATGASRPPPPCRQSPSPSRCVTTTEPWKGRIGGMVMVVEEGQEGERLPHEDVRSRPPSSGSRPARRLRSPRPTGRAWRSRRCSRTGARRSGSRAGRRGAGPYPRAGRVRGVRPRGVLRGGPGRARAPGLAAPAAGVSARGPRGPRRSAGLHQDRPSRRPRPRPTAPGSVPGPPAMVSPWRRRCRARPGSRGSGAVMAVGPRDTGEGKVRQTLEDNTFDLDNDSSYRTLGSRPSDQGVNLFAGHILGTA